MEILGLLHTYETGALSQGVFYTIRGHDVVNAMASNQHSPQRRSTCSAKYVRNVAIFTQIYVGHYSCLTSKTNNKAPFVSGFSPDFIHRDIQNSLDGLLKLFSFSVLGLKPSTCHKHILIYEGWSFNSGNYLFTTDTKYIHVSKFYCPSM